MATPTTKRARTEAWGSIRALPSGRYQARYIGPDGERYSAKTDAGVSVTFGTKTDARAWLNKVHKTVIDGTWESPDDRAARLEREAVASKAHRFAAYAETWVSQRRNRLGKPLGKKTQYDYRLQINKGLAEFADLPLTEITAAKVREWHTARAAVAATAAGNEARLLRAIMNTAIIDEIITKNPVDSAMAMSKTGIKHRPPTLDELGTLLDEITPFFRLAIVLAAYGGNRLSEWRAHRRMDLEKIGDRYRVVTSRQAYHVPGEGWVIEALKDKDSEVSRTVTLPAAVTHIVDEHLERFVDDAPDSLLFPSARSEFLHNIQWNDAWNKAREAAGLRVPKEGGGWDYISREHDLRAFAGTMYAQSGATLAETMEFLGHTTTVAAMAYQKTTGRGADLADRMPFPAAKR